MDPVESLPASTEVQSSTLAYEKGIPTTGVSSSKPCSDSSTDAAVADSMSLKVPSCIETDSSESSDKETDLDTDRVSSVSSQLSSDNVSESEETVENDAEMQSEADSAANSPCSEVEEEKERPGETIFERHQTVMIFDWDDTLLPSTWLTLHGMRLDDDTVVPEELEKLLTTLSEQVMRTLESACELGNVLIVTNAETGWIELSGRKFMPNLTAYLEKKNFRVVSARSMYEPTGVTSPFEWKNRAFSHEIEQYFTQLPSHQSSCKRNIISFGDSAHEREAILNLDRFMVADHVTKSLKFVERPMIDQLKKEHELINGCLRQIVYHSMNLDLCVRTQ